MDHYVVVDDFLPYEQFVSIRDAVMGKQFAWYYSSAVGNYEEKDDYYFIHTFFDEGKCCSGFMELLVPMFKKINAKEIIRAKANLYPNVGVLINNEPHIDYDQPHRGAVFYINTNNGCTVLEDGTQIYSVENRILLFNSGSLHNSTSCTDVKRRVTININYL